MGQEGSVSVGASRTTGFRDLAEGSCDVNREREQEIGEAVRSAMAAAVVPVHCLAVRTKPKSGKPAELFDYEGISSGTIVRKVKELAGG
jgi:hypothetical protein